MEKPKRFITPDYIQIKLKQGWTMQDFCNDLGMSEEAILSFMNKHSNNRTYGTFSRQVKQNEQLAEKKRRNDEKKINSHHCSEDVEETQVTSSTESDTTNSVFESTVQEVTQKEVEIDPITAEIDSLYNKIKIKESELASKNSLKSQLATEHENLSLKIVRMQSNIERLSKELEMEKQNLSKATQRDKVVMNHATTVDKDISRLLSTIGNFKTRIKELQKISISVSEDGEISINKPIEIPDSWKVLYPKLLADSIVENITVKQVQQLSKLLVLHEKLQKEGAYFEFIFENDSPSGKDSVKILYEIFTEKTN